MNPKTNSEEPDSSTPEGSEETQPENLAAEANAAQGIGGTGTIKVTG
jgi:hypothetical protein